MMQAAKVIACGLLVTVLCGCQAAKPRPDAALFEGESAYLQRDYHRADARLSTFIQLTNDTAARARALYVRGMTRALLGQRAAAYADLDAAARTAADTQLRWSANATLGALQFEDGHWDTAARALYAAVTTMPRVAPRDALLYRLSLCYERLGHWPQALSAQQQIVAEFGSGPYGDLARRRVELQAGHFAVQCGVYGSQENADRMVRNLWQQTLRPYVQPERRGGVIRYVVLVGRYESYAQAVQALAQVKGYVPDAVLWP